MNDDPDDVVRLPVQHKTPPGERMLVEVPPHTCCHWPASYEVDVKGGKCRCLLCMAEVSPMFVLEMLMREESQWMRTRHAYQDEMQRLGERSRTLCQHCGKLTRISHR